MSRSRTAHPPHGDLVMGGQVVVECPYVDILGVRFDPKMTFELHVRSLVSRVSSKLGILRLARGVFGSPDIVRRCYYAFVLPVLEYCSVVWGSAAECHLTLLDRLVHSAERLCPGQSFDSLGLRRRVASLCMLYKVFNNPDHYLYSRLPPLAVRGRHTRAAVAAHDFELEVCRCRTVQFGRSFVPRVVREWNGLPEGVFSGSLDQFKRSVNLFLRL